MASSGVSLNTAISPCFIFNGSWTAASKEIFSISGRSPLLNRSLNPVVLSVSTKYSNPFPDNRTTSLALNNFISEPLFKTLGAALDSSAISKLLNTSFKTFSFLLGPLSPASVPLLPIDNEPKRESAPLDNKREFALSSLVFTSLALKPACEPKRKLSISCFWSCMLFCFLIIFSIATLLESIELEERSSCFCAGSTLLKLPELEVFL